MGLPTVSVTGNVKRSELKNVQGKNLTKFQVECSEKRQNGEWDNLYLTCEVWEKASDFFQQYFKNGSAITVVGKLHTHSYQKQDGTKAYENKMLYTKIEFVPKDKCEVGQGGHNQTNQAMQQNQTYQDNLNKGNEMMDNRNGVNNDENHIPTIDPDDDEIPF